VTKYIFIDESGDPGFKIGKGSSDFFVIALVIFEDTLEIEKTSVALKQLKRDLGFPDEMEFKFSKSRNSVRERFLNKVKGFDFKIRALVVKKSDISSEQLKTHKKSFYSYFIKEVLKNGGGTILNAKIRIDGSGDREFRVGFISYLRKQLNSHEKPVMRDLKFVDSVGSIPIQLADMMAGTIRRSHEDDEGKKLKKIIKDLIEDEWRFK
jgi:hypothetical protein